ncbi:ATP-dependent RNA helicase HrpA [Luteococcus sp. Sow4_B9]|uniref:ATP-dependent RNA helicase HrpA n=1 Tax=Luteococcus sp. Sow4_B9 TaxID=3438792 RepID=UPI003F976A24
MTAADTTPPTAPSRQPSPASEPRLDFDPALPIAEHADEIAELIRDHQVVVVAGETGSGKTTQLPKICLKLGRGRIAHTQPRRIAARTVAERIAQECDTPLGDLVGYQVRFTRKAGKDTRVKVMTDGVLLAEITHDKLLRRYDTIIIDEAHERSLNIDFLLGYLKQLLPKRPDLKVIVTSATIDTARFAEHFSDRAGRPAPVIEVSGRTYPVEMRYRPLTDDGVDPDDGDQNDGICKAVKELSREGLGDILVFLSGEREIRDAAEAIKGLKLPDTEVLPLFARLSAEEQHRVFTPHTGRRIVLATNVAETSITVPGIRYVIDPGTARISRYSARTKVQRLPIEPVSQASANQRAGRCGRVAPGIAIRLYSEEDFLSRPEFTEPEILRTNLASVILQMAEAGLGDIGSFPFVEAPDRGQITDGLRLLDELGALKPGNHSHPRLTQIGHRLARIPLDPRLGRMLLEAEKQGCVREMLVLVAGLAIPDVRERPAEKREQADQLHRRFWTPMMPDDSAGGDSRSPSPSRGEEGPKRHTAHTRAADRVASTGGEPDSGGDIMAMLRLWEYLRRQRRELSGNAFRRMCRDEFIHFLRVREWEDLHAQLRDIAKEIGLQRNTSPAPDDKVLTAVLSGLLGHVGLADLREQDQPKKDRNGKRRRSGPREYLGARGARFAIQPGSALAKNPPPLVMAVELVETSRLWARTVAAITAEQVEEVAGDLLKRQYSEPHWSTNSGSVVAYEKVTLYGVPIVAERPVSYARIDPAVAREIFIRSALVEGQWRTRHHFFHHNRKVREQAEELEERSRRRDITVDDQAIFEYYDKRIPAEIVSVNHFDAWLRQLKDKRLLEMELDDLLAPQADEVDAGAFPDHWIVPSSGGGELRLDIDYVFDPGSGHDGVSVTIPLEQLNQVSAEPFSWQVPGLREELATELIRALPKSVRTNFVPAPNHARAALEWLDEMAKVGQGADHSRRFCDELGRALRQLTSVTVEPQQWNPDAVPEHLRVAFRVTESGRETRRSKDFADLRQDLARRVTQTLTKASAKKAVTGATGWTMGPIDRTLSVERNGTKAVGYPALKDEGASVGVEVLDTAERASQSHARGLRRLLVLTLPDPTKWVVGHLDNADKLALGNSPYASVPALLADARLKTAETLARRWAAENRTSLDNVRDAEAYEKLALFVRQEQADAMRQVVSTAAQTLRHETEARMAMNGLSAGDVLDDVTAQLENLVFTNFISATPDPWYQYLPRYVRGITLRLAGAAANPSRDRQGAAVIDELEYEYAELCRAQPPGPLPSAVEEIGFLIEELRVQQFAQQLRTSVTVSPKRIRKAIKEAG